MKEKVCGKKKKIIKLKTKELYIYIYIYIYYNLIIYEYLII